MSTQSAIKLQAFLAKAGVTSRRKAEELIAQSRVKVNQTIAHIGQRINPKTDSVYVDDKLVNKLEEHYYFLINKPAHYISTTSDELHRKTVLDVLPKIPGRLYPVGRLDQDSEGLMLLTNDGDLAYQLTHPKFEIEKTYEVELDRPISDKAFEHLSHGVKLKDGFTQPTHLETMELGSPGTWLSITITEGRNHQVKRMLERVGYEVVRLIRTQMGPFSLDMLEGKLYKRLTSTEVKSLLEHTSKEPAARD